MNAPPEVALQGADWALIAVYLAAALGVGFMVKGRADAGRESYFLANRALPWWWAGMSIAATTFAADTPLAVTGIVASKGLSGNWIWLSWIGVHAAVVVFFAATWNRSGVLTDAELVSLRYSGRPAAWLRSARAGLYGVVYNAIILGWVLRAMVKIATPFFHWDRWIPGVVGALERVWPAGTALGTPAEGLTVLVLLAIVCTYSSLGGIRGVILTDLVQLTIALIGSAWFAWVAWSAVGGRAGLVEGLTRLYGADHVYLDLFPRPGAGWLGMVEIGAFLFGLYLIVQSYANVPADGGGYLMQRLNTTRNSSHARRAALLFVILQYVVRVWPWFVVALAALVLIPLGSEATALGGAAAAAAGDRELAYPVLMGYLLRPGVVGVLVTSMLAAFMSTVDTHINWGASYIVNDVYLRLRPDAPPARQVRVARLAVVGFVVMAVLVSFQIDTIEQAWKWVAVLGAALGVPTAARWLWWRVSAAAEIGALAAGLGCALLLGFTGSVAYELRLIIISAASVAGMAAGMAVGPATDRGVLDAFVARVRPHGFWPGRPAPRAAFDIALLVGRWLAVIAGVVALLYAFHRALLLGELLAGAVAAVLGVAVLAWGAAGARPVAARGAADEAPGEGHGAGG